MGHIGCTTVIADWHHLTAINVAYCKIANMHYVSGFRELWAEKMCNVYRYKQSKTNIFIWYCWCNALQFRQILNLLSVEWGLWPILLFLFVSGLEEAQFFFWRSIYMCCTWLLALCLFVVVATFILILDSSKRIAAYHASSLYQNLYKKAILNVHVKMIEWDDNKICVSLLFFHSFSGSSPVSPSIFCFFFACFSIHWCNILSWTVSQQQQQQHQIHTHKHIWSALICGIFK